MTPGIDQLTAAGIKREVAEKWLPHVQKAMARFSIESERQVAAWLAQTAHESGGYTMLVENLNYKAATLAACWPQRFAVLGPDKKPVKDDKGKLTPTAVANSIAGKPELIANMVYSSRMGNGPAESGEGWKYRGRGLKQLTGKDNYTRCGAALELDIVANPDLLLEPEGAALSAAWFWSVNKCGALADADDFVGLTKKINGGTIGLPDREKRYKAVLATLGH
jgi:putative chitinase